MFEPKCDNYTVKSNEYGVSLRSKVRSSEQVLHIEPVSDEEDES